MWFEIEVTFFFQPNDYETTLITVNSEIQDENTDSNSGVLAQNINFNPNYVVLNGIFRLGRKCNTYIILDFDLNSPYSG